MLAFDMKLPASVIISKVEAQKFIQELKPKHDFVKTNIKEIISDFDDVFSEGLRKIKRISN